MMNRDASVVCEQTTILLPHLDEEITALRMTDGRLYIPAVALCSVLGIRADSHIRRWQQMAFWDEAIKLLYRHPKGYQRTVWCLPLSMVPFACDCFDWELVSAERRNQLKKLVNEAIRSLNQVHMHLVDTYQMIRKTVFHFLTSMDGVEEYWRAKAEQLAPHLDEAIRAQFLELFDEGCGIITTAKIHARTIAQWQAETPIIDLFSVAADGTITDTGSMPLLPVIPREACEQFFTFFAAMEHWYHRFDTFLGENGL